MSVNWYESVGASPELLAFFIRCRRCKAAYALLFLTADRAEPPPGECAACGLLSMEEGEAASGREST